MSKSKSPREIVCNEDTFLLPPYRFEMYCIETECPETGKTSCSTCIAQAGTIDVPEQGCTVSFKNSDGSQAEQSIKLIREDAEAVAEKRRANEEAQRLADAEKEAEKEAEPVEMPVEKMVDEYMDENPQCIAKEEECDEDECVDMACDEMMCEEDDTQFDEQGDYTYPTED